MSDPVYYHWSTNHWRWGVTASILQIRKLSLGKGKCLPSCKLKEELSGNLGFIQAGALCPLDHSQIQLSLGRGPHPGDMASHAGRMLLSNQQQWEWNFFFWEARLGIAWPGVPSPNSARLEAPGGQVSCWSFSLLLAHSPPPTASNIQEPNW